jgi:predicted dehydrogenase
VDAVYVATPPCAHKEYCLLAARARKPVYVEKPMAMSAHECDEMVDACRAAGVPLFVAYYRRALPRFLAIKDAIDRGEIGDVRAVTVLLARPLEAPAAPLSWRVDPATAGGGHFVDLAAHTLDFLDFVLGPIARADGHAVNQAGRYAAEDIVVSTMVFESGARGSGTWCFSGTGNVDRTEILGTGGRVTFATFDSLPVVIETGEGARELVIPHPPHVQQPLIQTIVDELNGRGICPSTGETAARTTRIMEGLLRGYYKTQDARSKTQDGN